MNLKTLFFCLILCNQIFFSQKEEKFKPSKIQSISVVDVEKFDHVECTEEFDFYFEKGSKPQVKFETHENMHTLIQAKTESGRLKFIFLEKPKTFKKLKITIFYDDSLNQISSRGEASVYALERLKLQKLTINAADKSRLFINADVEELTLSMDQKAKGELNVNASLTKVVSSQSSSLVAMITTKNGQFDLYQSGSITLEGGAESAKIRATNNTDFVGKKFSITKSEVMADLNANVTVFVVDQFTLSATGDANIYFLGTAKLDVLKFDNDALLQKRSK